MKTKFMINGSTINVFRMNEETALDFLPPKVYTVKHAQMTGFYLEMTKDRLDTPLKIYGKAMERVEKCTKTYQDRSTSTGILLTGDKGTGKSLLMSLLANNAIDELQLPIILIKDPFSGTQFMSFIESLGECCLIFDEFGKMYVSSDRQMHNNDDGVSQKVLLSLMDGVDKTKRLIIMTENNEIDINEFMLNRPSRIYYHFRYKKLDEDSIIGYCNDHAVNKRITKEITELSRRTAIFSFDMLQSIVEEHLRFNSPIKEITVDLNIDLREDIDSMIEIVKVVEKSTEEIKELHGTHLIKRPGNYVYIEIKGNNSKPNTTGELEAVCADNGESTEVYLEASDLVYEHDGKLVYDTTLYTIVARVIPPRYINYTGLL